MGIGKFLATQLRQPSGWFGKYIVSRALNKDNAAMNDLALEMLIIGDKRRKERILEIDFGGGYLLEKILSYAGVEFVAVVDISPEIVNICQLRFGAEIVAKRLELCCMSWDNLSYPPSHFTKVCTVNTIYFWNDVMNTLVSLHKVLKPGGLLVLCFNTKDFLSKTMLPKHGFRMYEPQQIKKWMEIVGFGNIRHASVTAQKQDFICLVGEKQLQAPRQLVIGAGHNHNYGKDN